MPVNIAVLTVSDTRSLEEDKSGDLLSDRIKGAGHNLQTRDLVKDNKSEIIKEIPGFGEIFRVMSYEKIGTSTIQSRAIAGVSRGTYLFALPGSPSACRDAWDEILIHQLDYRFKPCNLVELMPRLLEV